MLRTVRLTGYVAVLCVLSLLGLSLIVLEPQPIATLASPPKAESLARLRAVAHDLSSTLRRPEGKAQFVLFESDLNAALSFAGRAKPGLRAAADLNENRISTVASMHLGQFFGDKYLNAEMELAWMDDELQVTSASLGALPLPGGVLKRLGQFLIDRHLGDNAAATLEAGVEGFATQAERLVITYKSSPEVAGIIERPIIGPALAVVPQDSVAHYVDIVVEERKSSPTDRELASLLNAMFLQAMERSKTMDPVVENRALLLALGASVGHAAFRRFAGLDRQQANKAATANGQFQLGGRNDLARHFALASGLEAAMGDNWSETAGIYKELSDSWKGGSGFSFADLAADQAGVHLAKAALLDAESARRTQAIFASVTEGDFFPSVGEEREGLSDKAFMAQYGTVDAHRFHAEKERIDTSIKSLPGFRALAGAF